MKKIDVTKHVLVPPFTKLTPEQITELLEKLNISLLQLPAIFSKDPMVKAVDAIVGDIIKIERITPSKIKEIYYRRVVA